MITLDPTAGLGLVLMAISLAGAAYLMFAAIAVRKFSGKSSLSPSDRPPVTILKPLCGDDPGLYVNLCSFCEQAYPEFQIVFGVHRPDDPAAAVVRRVIADYPDADLALVIDPRLYGTNYKISNLINMMAAARHDLIVIADSDMRVRREYLDAVVAPLLEPGVGLVTCLYRGQPDHGVWSALGAMFVNHGFLPGVLVGRLIGGHEGCFGATMALRRETLDRIGGFRALRDHLADDYALGVAVRQLGLTVELSTHVVDNQMHEPDLRSLVFHELRWARTMRLIEPGGYAASIITFPILPSLLALALTHAGGPSLITLAIVLACRYMFMAIADDALGLPTAQPWLAPVRDLLSVGVLIASFCITSVTWRQQRFRVLPDGRLILDGELSS